ncbi:Luciferase-like monooxygenase [Rhodococcoides kyotonense]|uniref:Luciferase-like monooxygenase n=1 Tax=Rhodococcoides kyotonense TaxID=398843 RepID=A0A239JC00_9NOCA|nr:Luciferase-like monooxygenase [Rhodococcus kyotonensis]
MLIQAGTSDDGRDLSAQVADVVFSFARTKESAAELKSDILSRAQGRDDLLFVPGLSVVIRDTDDEARQALDEIHARVPIERLLAQVQRLFGGRSFVSYDLDAPFPRVDPSTPESLAGAASLASQAAVHGWTLRQALHSLIEHWATFVGTPTTIADEIERWYRSGAADGFNLFVQDPGDWRRFRTEVVPILVERGLARADYTSDTLRGHLGLPIPENTHTASRKHLVTTE